MAPTLDFSTSLIVIKEFHAPTTKGIDLDLANPKAVIPIVINHGLHRRTEARRIKRLELFRKNFPNPPPLNRPTTTTQRIMRRCRMQPRSPLST
jgi:hypothetical protein